VKIVAEVKPIKEENKPVVKPALNMKVFDIKTAFKQEIPLPVCQGK